MKKNILSNFKKIASRLSGISTPFFGVSWRPAKEEREVIKNLLVSLEDRRVLYQPFIFELDEHVFQSVQQIRDILTEAKQLLPEESKAIALIDDMRIACREFLKRRHYVGYDRVPILPSEREGRVDNVCYYYMAANLGLIDSSIKNRINNETETNSSEVISFNSFFERDNVSANDSTEMLDIRSCCPSERLQNIMLSVEGVATLFMELGKLREVFGRSIGMLVVGYNCHVHGELSNLLPKPRLCEAVTENGLQCDNEVIGGSEFCQKHTVE